MAGWLIVRLLVAVQLFASVTVTVKLPALTFVKLAELPALLQR